MRGSTTRSAWKPRLLAGGRTPCSPNAPDNSDVSADGPYGDLIATTVRVLTWNVWGRFGSWQAREAALIGTLKTLQPDVVALQEC